jgi:hypothetical protein
MFMVKKTLTYVVLLTIMAAIYGSIFGIFVIDFVFGKQVL